MIIQASQYLATNVSDAVRTRRFVNVKKSISKCGERREIIAQFIPESKIYINTYIVPLLFQRGVIYSSNFIFTASAEKLIVQATILTAPQYCFVSKGQSKCPDRLDVSTCLLTMRMMRNFRDTENHVSNFTREIELFIIFIGTT